MNTVGGTSGDSHINDESGPDRNTPTVGVGFCGRRARAEMMELVMV